ncbi:uncharacterized protein LOC108161582 [Drosophila miranda]|uniref:uncharacterized protein LOC108161582 n=1 Tax=Drosophila miranda TaxID=7229 RepID=UPI0007E6FD65|nr:uncharacterized protein LOC108161582 [Drosophila miranda]
MSYSTAISMAQSLISNMQQVGQVHWANAASRVINPIFKSTTGKMLISFVLGYYASKSISKIWKKPADEEEPDVFREPLKLTLQQLSTFNGQDNKPTYTAFNGKIYDLTSCIISQDDEIFRLIAGCDAGPVLQKTYKGMGISTFDPMRRWEMMMESECTIVGYLIEHYDFEGLHSHQTDEDGEDGSTVVDLSEQLGEF